MPEDIIDENKPWLVLPYFAGDMGRQGIERNPLPPQKATWWLCPSIRVNGGPLRVYTPGQPFDVVVDTRNYGGGAAETLIYITVWWSSPTAGFGSAKWFGAAQSVIGTKGAGTSATITGTVPVGAPSHVCLLVSVEAAFNDNLPAVIGPGSDRHWAQLNIDAVTAPNGMIDQEFMVGNPQQTPARVHVRAVVLAGDRLAIAAEALQIRPFQPDRTDLRVSIAGEDPPEHLDGAVPVDLEAGASISLELRGEISPPPEPGTATIVELVQYAPHDSDTVFGALAIVVTVD